MSIPADLIDKKDALIATAKRCFDLRLQTNAGGNLSVRLDAIDAIVIKPSGIGFNECTRDNLQVVHLDGTIGVGATLMKAQYLAEIIEETAHIAYVRDTLMAAHGKSTADLPQLGTNTEEKAALGV